MTIFELYQRLKEKGYVNPHADWQAVNLFEGRLRDSLELDRREVFKVWYGEDGTVERELPSGKIRHWENALADASEDYMYGDIGTCIEYILQHP